jgi:hypothetical protein
MPKIMQLSDHIYVLIKGRLSRLVRPEEVRSNAQVVDAYLVVPKVFKQKTPIWLLTSGYPNYLRKMDGRRIKKGGDINGKVSNTLGNRYEQNV